MTIPLDIDPDIRVASTLPASFYRDATLHEALVEHVFARSWQLLATTDRIKAPQQVLPLPFLDGCVEEPIVLTRDGDDRLHCLSNVCTHRGMLVAGEPGRAAHLRCPYHGRRFALDGAFEHMPEFEDAAAFPSGRDDLRRLPLETWGPFLFAAVDPAFGFDQLVAPMTERMGWLPLDQLAFHPTRSRDYLVQANWALYCDNYLEGFHIPFVHADLNTTVDYGQYRTELHRYGNVQIGVSKGGEHTFDLPPDSPDHGQSIGAYYFWLFPNLMFNFYPWGVSVNVVKPLAVDRTRVSFLAYVLDESKLEAGAGAALDRVEREDEQIVEAVQRGVQSRIYERGRYSPTREQGVHHFHRLLAEFATGPAGPAAARSASAPTS
ncbi:MAG: aromatic ring-hydroxylating oxygenase subunit alpha [Planctomycetota bacterium]|jgi:choline monooxygenase